MESSIEAIVEAQRSALQRSLAGLRLILDEDDDWRALAALLAVGEDAGGITDHAWSVRHVELIEALEGKLAYCLFNELERTLAALSNSRLFESTLDDVLSPAELSTTAHPAADEMTPGVAPGNRPEDVSVVIHTAAVRRESIAERIATLAMPGSIASAAAASAEQYSGNDFPPSSPKPDLVAEAAHRILAAMTTHSAEDGEPSAIAVEDAPEEEAQVVSAEPVPHGVPAAPDKFEVAEAAAERDPYERYLELAGFDEDAPAVEDDDHLEFAGDDFEAEVEIIHGPVLDPGAGRTDLAPVEPDDAGDIEPSSIGDDAAETLEQRLVRLDRQSESLVSLPRKSVRSVSSEDDEADKWLEMIRARRAKMTRPSVVQVADTLPIAPVSDASLAGSGSGTVGTFDAEDAFDDDPYAYEEAEVRVVQKVAVPARDGSADAAPQSGAPAVPRTRPAKDYAAIPGPPAFGLTEEASVEIVRRTTSRPTGKANEDKIGPVPEAEPQNRSQRFIRALTGE